MFTAAPRVQTLLALGTLTAVSAASWGLAAWDHLSAQDDRLDLAAAITFTVSTVLVFANARREKRDREARVRNLAMLMPLVADRVTPRGGDGQDQPQPQPHWYHYLKQPA